MVYYDKVHCNIVLAPDSESLKTHQNKYHCKTPSEKVFMVQSPLRKARRQTFGFDKPSWLGAEPPIP